MTNFSQSSDRTRTRIFIGQCCWLMLYVFQLMMMALYEISDDQYIDGLSVFLGAFVSWVFVSWRITMGHWVDLYSVFFIALFLFSGGQAVLNLLGLMPQGILDGYALSSLQVKHALTLVVGCLLAFHTGALLRARQHAPSGLPAPAALDTAEVARQVGLLLILVSLGPGLYDLYQDASVIQNIGYGGQFFLATSATGMDAWTRNLTMFLLPGALLFLAGSKGRPVSIAVAWVVIAGPAIIYFLLGIRNVGIRGLVALLWLHSVTIRPIRKSVLVGSTLIVLLLIPALAVVRGKALTLGDTISAIQQSYSAMENPLVLALAEMGGTLLTVIYTIDLVPTVKPYEWGMSYVMALTTVFPNLFWNVHPAIQAGIPSAWLMKEIDPIAANAGFSLGYSMIAEAYLNFSWIGAPIAMAGLGYLLAGFVCWVFECPDALRLAMQAILMSILLFVPRAESQLVIRELFFVGLMLYLFVLYLIHRRIPVSQISTTQTASPGHSGGQTTVPL